MASGKLINKTAIKGAISPVNALKSAAVTSGSGITDHSRLTNKSAPDQHPIEAITGLRSELDSKLNSTTALPLIEEALQGKAKGLYFDAMKEFARKSYWYLTAEIDPKTGLGTKDSIISGPYDLGMGGGSGGGGGGGVTTVSIKQVNWPSAASVGNADTSTKIKVNWTSVIGEDRTPTGDGTLYLTINGRQVETRPKQPQGEIEFDISQYIVSGDNTIQIKVLDTYGTTGITVGTITGISLELKSTFNQDLAYYGKIDFTYTPIGNVTKKVYFILDGDEKNAAHTIVKSSNELQTYTLRGLSHGAHTLKVYFEADIGGQIISSNVLFYDITFVESGNSTPIIASEFSKFTQEQYISFNIPYRVFIDGRNAATVTFKVNGKVIRSSEVTTNGTHIWAYRYDDYTVDANGNTVKEPLVLEIVCKTVIKRFEVIVKESTIAVTPVLNNLELALATTGRSNDDLENRENWSYTTTPPPGSTEDPKTYTCTFTDFNWKSDGWVLDKTDAAGNPTIDSTTVLRVGGSARVNIPLEVFANNFTGQGKTIELEIATHGIRDYESTIISCLDNEKTPFYTVEPLYTKEEERLQGYEVSYIYSILSEVISVPGKYLFTYNGTSWTHNVLDENNQTVTSVVNLSDYGITLTECLINAEGEDLGSVIAGDRILINFSMEARGFEITPQVASIRSQQSFLSTQYKEDEHVRISFVVEPSDADHNRIIWMYINGVASGAMQYPTGENFQQKSPNFITIGSSEAIVDIYNIRVYNMALTNRQVVNNWIADTADPSLKATRFNHNQVLNEQDQVTPASLNIGAPDLPYIIWDIDPLPQSKNDVRPGNAYYTDPSDSTRDFTAIDAEYKVQGTSSAVYPTKNIRLRTKKGKGGPNLEWYDADGNDLIIKNGGKGFPITTPNGFGVDYFTFKVDYASSEGANNVELTKLYNDASIKYGLLTPPQQQDSKVRVGIDGFPIVAFHQNSKDEITFCTKANFNNDKGNENVYGFKEGDESWETTNNSAAETKYQKPVTVENFAKGFEIRFPDEDGYNEMNKLGPMTAWVYSTYQEEADPTRKLEPKVTLTYTKAVSAEDGSFSATEVTETFEYDTREYRLAKFKAELKDWFNVDSCLFYYLFTELFLMIDSRAKNAFPTYYATRTNELVTDKDGNTIPNTYTDGGNRWYWIPYDMDTAIGIDNKGKLTFDYYLEDIDQLDGADVYNGQTSVMWCNIRDAFRNELAAMYLTLRNQGLISYNEVEKRFEEHQSKWPEVILNLDAHNKYIVPLKNGDNYLEMLQGTKAQQRKWWLYNRFKYMDSKYNAGDAKADFVQFRAYVDMGQEKPNLEVTPYANIYATASFGNGEEHLVSKRALTRGESITLENTFRVEDDENDQETYIYSASQLKSIGDISPFHPDTVKIGNAIRLQDLKVGDDGTKYPGYTNPYLKELTVGANTLLKTIDARNCINLGTGTTVAPDLSQCTNIEEIYFTGTKIKGITLPEGGTIKKLHLPGTLTALTIQNHPLLEDLKIENTNTTITRSSYNKDDYTVTGVVINKDRWNDANANANVYLADSMDENMQQLRVSIADKNLYDQLIIGESKLTVKCTYIDTRYDLFNDTEVRLIEYSTRLINSAYLTTINTNVSAVVETIAATIETPAVSEFKISLIETLWLEGIPSKAIKAKEFIKNMKSGTRVRLININETYGSWEEIKEFYDLLDRHYGINFNNSLTEPKAQVTGIINVNSIPYVKYIELTSRYPEVTINAKQIESTVTFYNDGQEYDRQTIYLDTELDSFKKLIIKGTTISEPVEPTKQSIQSHYYKFENWRMRKATLAHTIVEHKPPREDGKVWEYLFTWGYDSYASVEDTPVWTTESLITGDTRIDTEYSAHLQQYTITFDTNSTDILVTPPSITTEWGNTITRPDISNIPEGVTLDGWYYSNDTEWNFDTSKVVMNTILTAKWIDTSLPNIKLTRQTYNSFQYEATDTLGVIGWAVLKNPIDPELPPTEWNTVPTTTKLIGTYAGVDGPGDYYFWILDAGENDTGVKHTKKEKIVAYKLEAEYFTGVTAYHFTENSEVASSTFALQETPLKLHVDLDTHYEALKVNDILITDSENIWSFTVSEDCYFTLTCSPKIYTVEFNLLNKGTTIDSQPITYQHHVLEPLSQYWRESNEVIIGWSLSPSDVTQLWNFETMTVDRGLTLYAVWETLHMPTILTLEIPEDETPELTGGYKVTFNYRNAIQGTELSPGELVKFNFGDEDPDTFSVNENGLITHIYETPGKKVVTIYGNNKGYSLGRSLDIPLVEPSKYLTEASLAWDLAKINEGAFRNSSLTTVPLTDYITLIDAYAFAGCTKLETFSPTRSIIEIGESAFNGCASLKTLNFIGSSVTTLRDSAFSNCSALEQLELPETIIQLKTNCFSNCKNLSEVILRSPNLKMERYVFNLCDSLTSIGPLNSDADIKYAWKTEIPNYAFAMGNRQTNINHIILSPTIERIGEGAFQSTLIKKITHSGEQNPLDTTLILPESLRSIGAHAFKYCRLLNSIVIPATINSIGANAFANTPISTADLYLTDSIEKADNAAEGWFFGAGTTSTRIRVPESIFNEETSTFPEDYFGEYWHVFSIVNDKIEFHNYEVLDEI